MAERKVGLLNSEGTGSCQVCGFPTPIHRLYWFDGRLVCRYHLRPRTYAQMMSQVNRGLKLFHGHIHIQGEVPIDEDGNEVPPPFTTGPVTPPPPTGGGGGGTGGGNPGTGTPPGGNPPPDPTASYIDGSCTGGT